MLFIFQSDILITCKDVRCYAHGHKYAGICIHEGAGMLHSSNSKAEPPPPPPPEKKKKSFTNLDTGVNMQEYLFMRGQGMLYEQY